eukprot:TRINITY_DN75089_c0_g1_i1.p1 TRINITY_DN75089_c0_g1~~TRINITY_DN75089_c0_g1_i1.p1  ORF type:complete len:212 (-),score=58.69 TRINITY_DN75089_c0_g1_i1:626-1261(-)
MPPKRVQGDELQGLLGHGDTGGSVSRLRRPKAAAEPSLLEEAGIEQDEDDNDTDGYGSWRARALAAARGAEGGGASGDVESGGGATAGVTRETLVAGDGQTVAAVGDECAVHYTGMLAADGSVFDSSLQCGGPFVFNLGFDLVAGGWEGCVAEMTLGEKARIHVPAAFAFGAQGLENIVPPNADVLYEVQLLAVNGEWAAGQKRPLWCSLL